MGFAFCRFHEETGCDETGSQEYHVHLEDLDVMINVPSMWEHYMTKHLVQPTKREKEVIMSADPEKATGRFIQTRGTENPEELMVLYVEKTESGYTHQIGTKPDTKFIEKLETILKKFEPYQTKGFKPGYR
nr:hypothetical protein [Nanoarchaeota archaeon]